MEKKSKSWIYSVYYHLHCCIEELKLAVGGRSSRGAGHISSEMILQITLLFFQDLDYFDLAEKPLLIDFS